jgi:hypothetical protein
MTFKALLLDERDVFVELVTLTDDAQLTERHVDLRQHGGDCDRPVGEYRWNREKKALEALPRQQRATTGKPTLEQAVAFNLMRQALRAKADLQTNQAVELVWLDEVLTSHDFKGLHKAPLVVEYAQARGLDLSKG